MNVVYKDKCESNDIIWWEKMTKFKCKKCGKMIPIIEQQEEQVCSNCGTEYEHVYDGGWKYDIKG